MAGKWQFDNFEKHPNHRRDSGFTDYMSWTWQYKGKTNRYWNPSLWHDAKLVEPIEGKYGPDLCTDFSVDFIRKHKSEPFLLYYPSILGAFSL